MDVFTALKIMCFVYVEAPEEPQNPPVIAVMRAVKTAEFALVCTSNRPCCWFPKRLQKTATNTPDNATAPASKLYSTNVGFLV